MSQNVWAFELWSDVEKSVKSTPELAGSRQKILAVIQKLKKEGVYTQGGMDEKKRAVFVGLQSAVEHVLSLHKKENPNFKLVMAYHTPQPATPLCTAYNSVGEGIIHESLRQNREIQYGVSSRAKIVRYLLDEGAQMFVVYQKGGLKERTPEQQKIYKSEVKKYKSFLKSRELKIPKINPEMIGATHLFENEKGQPYVFFIKATQANNPSDTVWQIGLGPLQNSQVADRLNAVLNYLANTGQPGIKSAFEKNLNPLVVIASP